ncbi:hypothetical protein RhiirA4_480396 [Rhizophagus irregularis]|uniref:Uncharacterized protein n=1 Tax=Rhizophagus irregularis TaxID=588596 RepID=A0A2I1HHV1_9GLOM|nr:hypothetical protein RhiirA4_480396 [Rhizophagus irregularis]
MKEETISFDICTIFVVRFFTIFLKNGQKFRNSCIGLDGKYDLNNDHAPILIMIIENNIGCATPLAFN